MSKPIPKSINFSVKPDDRKHLKAIRTVSGVDSLTEVIRMALKSLYEQQRASSKQSITVYTEPEVSTK